MTWPPAIEFMLIVGRRAPSGTTGSSVTRSPIASWSPSATSAAASIAETPRKGIEP